MKINLLRVLGAKFYKIANRCDCLNERRILSDAMMGVRPKQCVIGIICCLFLWYIFLFLTRDVLFVLMREEGASEKDLRQDCQFLEEQVTGEEGKIDEEIGSIRSVTVAFRHGERSTLYGNFDVLSMDCAAYRDSDRRAFMDYATLVASPFFAKFLTADSAFNDFFRAPHASICSRGNLTAEGALQLLKLGNFLRQRYTDNAFLESSEDIQLDISFHSTKYQRTFQSAVAFISTFFYPLHNIFPNVHLHASNNQQFCDNVACKCDNLLKAEKIYEETRTEFFENLVGKNDAMLYRGLVDVLQIERLGDPLHFLDVMRGRYVCRRLPLPCRSHTCITYEKLSKIAGLTSLRDVAMFNDTTDSDPSIFRRLMVAQSLAIMQSISASIKKLRRFPHTKVLRVYSGHDITLRPLLFALGLKHHEPPHYAARFVVEIYEMKDFSELDSLHYFRLLYDGKDRTADLSFCSGNMYHDLCSVIHFENFIDSHLLTVAHVDSLNELCNDAI